MALLLIIFCPDGKKTCVGERNFEHYESTMVMILLISSLITCKIVWPSQWRNPFFCSQEWYLCRQTMHALLNKETKQLLMAISGVKEIESRWPEMGEGHAALDRWLKKAPHDKKEWARWVLRESYSRYEEQQAQWPEIRMVWGNSRNSSRLWGCNGDAGHKVERWPGVFLWPVEPIGQDIESLNCVLRIKENCRGEGLSRRELWSVLGSFVGLFYFVIRIILSVVYGISFGGGGDKRQSRETN